MIQRQAPDQSPSSPPKTISGSAKESSGDDVAAALRGFGPLGILAILAVAAGNFVVVPLSAVLVLLWARRSHTPWREIGYVRPKSWTRTIATGIVFGIAFKFLMKAIVMPLLGADPINQAYHYLAGNRAALPGILYAVTVGAGFGEETVFRGFMFERLGKGTIFAVTGRIWMLMFAHAAFDVTAVALIYWSLENDVAHLVFK